MSPLILVLDFVILHGKKLATIILSALLLYGILAVLFHHSDTKVHPTPIVKQSMSVVAQLDNSASPPVTVLDITTAVPALQSSIKPCVTRVVHHHMHKHAHTSKNKHKHKHITHHHSGHHYSHHHVSTVFCS
jgi:hypothetical protein